MAENDEKKRIISLDYNETEVFDDDTIYGEVLAPDTKSVQIHLRSSAPFVCRGDNGAGKIVNALEIEGTYFGRTYCFNRSRFYVSMSPYEQTIDDERLTRKIDSALEILASDNGDASIDKSHLMIGALRQLGQFAEADKNLPRNLR